MNCHEIPRLVYCRRREQMNIRKNVDYSKMYSALDAALIVNKREMEQYYRIGKAIFQRSEKRCCFRQTRTVRLSLLLTI